MDTIPLYQRVKEQIYEDFERLKRQQSVVLEARSKRKRVLALRVFRTKFLRFFFEIYALTTFDLLPKVIKHNLQHFAEDTKRIKSVDTVYDVILNSTIAMRELKLTKITFDKDNSSF